MIKWDYRRKAMSSFDDYYKKWKKEKGISTDTPYKNLTNEQKAQEASKDVNEMFENYRNNNKINTQKNVTVWEQVNNIANNNFNNSMNTSMMLNQNVVNNNQSIWDKINNLAFGNGTTLYKDNKRNTINYVQEDTNNNINNNTIWNAINKKENKVSSENPMLYSNNNMQIVPVEKQKEERNKSIWQDVSDLANLVVLGTSSGSKQTLNYIESANEKIFSKYKNIKEQQFLNSNNVSEEEKAIVKNEQFKTIMKSKPDYGKGNINLNNRKRAINEDGSISTVRSMSFEDENGKEVLIPTVINGKVVSDEEAIQHYYNTGEYLGKFNTVEEADKYAEELHNKQDFLYNKEKVETNLVKKEQEFPILYQVLEVDI